MIKNNEIGCPAILKAISSFSCLMGFTISISSLLWPLLIHLAPVSDPDFPAIALSTHSIQGLYLRLLCTCVYGLLLISSGYWVYRKVKKGWILMSFCFLFATIISGTGLLSLILDSGFSGCLAFLFLLFLFFLVGYIYLFTEKPRIFLNLHKNKYWQIILIQIAICLVIFVIIECF
jgi:hypothetical protein